MFGRASITRTPKCDELARFDQVTRLEAAGSGKVRGRHRGYRRGAAAGGPHQGSADGRIVAYDTANRAGQRMLDGTMLNAVLVLMLATSILGPVLTERFAPRMLGDGLRHDRPSVLK